MKLNIPLDRRGQDLKIIELLPAVGIFIFATILVMLYAAAQNSEHESRIESVALTIGSARTLTTLLNHPADSEHNERIIDLVRANDPRATAHITNYLNTYEPSITRYHVTRNGIPLAHSTNPPQHPSRATITLDPTAAVNITLEYDT